MCRRQILKTSRNAHSALRGFSICCSAGGLFRALRARRPLCWALRAGASALRALHARFARYLLCSLRSHATSLGFAFGRYHARYARPTLRRNYFLLSTIGHARHPLRGSRRGTRPETFGFTEKRPCEAGAFPENLRILIINCDNLIENMYL